MFTLDNKNRICTKHRLINPGLLFRGEVIPDRLLDSAWLPLHIHFNIMRVRKLADHLLVLPNQT